MKRKKILHIINGLGNGGAEKNLVRLIEQTSNNYNHVVISLTTEDFYLRRLESFGILVIRNNLRKNLLAPLTILKILYQIYKISPEIIHTWLYISDLIGGILGKILGIKKIVWTIRHDISKKSPINERILVRSLALFSNYIPNFIISCSKSAAQNHINFGYKKSKILIINNGVDIQKFRPSNLIKKKLIDKYNICNETLIFGMIARFAKVKNYPLLIEALSLLKNKISFKCLLIGDKISYKNTELIALINKFDLSNEIVISEERTKIHEILNLIDLLILTSHSECFPNVLIESMSCGVPCLSTNVGEASKIIGKTGWVINNKSASVLSSKLIEITIDGKSKIEKLKNLCRGRIKEYYSIERMIAKYKKLYSGL